MPRKKNKQNCILLDWDEGVSIGIIENTPVKWFYEVGEEGKGCPALLTNQSYERVKEGETFITESYKWTALFDSWNCLDKTVDIHVFHGMSSEVH